ncbi:hypothetical protein V6N11_030705 [Hibiscus sabdariffa]|uniref:RRM domain-containing protein n=1 Tax=Hibiscus sabdariffa TaxID=183260 RepID=A0ABR2NBV6_9ROSI
MGGVMRAVGKVSGVGIANATLRGGFHVSPPSSEHSVMRVAAATRSVSSSPIAVSIEGASSVADSTALGNQKSYWEMLDDWEFAGGVEEEVASEVSAPATGRGEPIARVLFGGVPSLEETQEATADLKDALDKVYLSSPNYGGAGQEPVVSLLSSSEETKDRVSYNVGAISVPQPAIHAFKLLNENPAVQSVVASIAADPNVWNAVLTNSAYMDFIKSQPTNDKFEYQASPQSSESSVKLEEYKDNDGADPFSDFLQKIKASVVEMGCGDESDGGWGSSTGIEADVLDSFGLIPLCRHRLLQWGNGDGTPGREQSPPSTNLFVSGLNKRTPTEKLREAFSQFGRVVDARVVTDRVSGYSKGFGFVRYATIEEAEKGRVGMDGKFLDGWVIFAEYARPRPERTPPQNNSNGYNSYGRE